MQEVYPSCDIRDIKAKWDTDIFHELTGDRQGRAHPAEPLIEGHQLSSYGETPTVGSGDTAKISSSMDPSADQEKIISKLLKTLMRTIVNILKATMEC